MSFLSFFLNDFKFFLPEIFLATSILSLTLYCSLVATSRELGFPVMVKSLNKLCLLVLFFTFLLVGNEQGCFQVVYQNTFIFDGLTASSKQVILFFTFVCLLISERSILTHKINNFEYLLLILSAVLGLMLLISSYDLISLYLCIELQSLCLYALAASKKDSSLSTEAGLKYFILGSFSSGLLLFGISLIYGCTGSTSFGSIFLLLASADNSSVTVLIEVLSKALFFISLAFFFKIAAAPLHMWSPDVYEGSPMSSTVFFAVIPKLALFSVFLRFFTVMGPNFSNFLLSLLVFFSLFSAVVGSFGALKQKKLKRLLAYSSVSHVGYLLLAMASCSFEGNQALFLYLIIYMVASVTIWSCVFSVDTFGNRFRAKTLADFAGVASLNPLLALTGMLSFFSLAGVPPLAGFLAKLSIFHAAICSSIILASVLSILTSVVASFYYIRLVKNLYFEPSRVVSSLRYSHKGVESLPLSVSRECSVVLGVGFFSLVILFAYPTPLFVLSQKMALCLF